MKLNLGSGKEKREGFVNIDYLIEADKQVNLEELPWPWGDSSVEEIYTEHCLEHLDIRPLDIFNEIWRICKGNAIVTIKVPNAPSVKAFRDPTHVRYYTDEMWKYLCSSQKEWKDETKKYSNLEFNMIENNSTEDLVIWKLKVIKDE